MSKTRARRGPLQARNDFGVSVSASKTKWRKPKYLKGGPFGGAPWEGRHKTTRTGANRTVRYLGRVGRPNYPYRPVSVEEGRTKVASNRCGNNCGRRAFIGDYLCPRCRSQG